MSRRLRAVLVDDERLARVELRRILSDHEPIEVIGEAEDAPSARALLADLAAAGTPPDVLFLDVQMPGETGFDLLASLDAVPPAVIFVTAYDAYALRAFEVSALDYLVKPIAPERLELAIGRLTPADTSHPDDAPRLGLDDRVFVKDGDQLHFVRLGDVRLFESEGNYVRLHLGGAPVLVLRSLNALEDRLDPASFFRASRKHLLNLEHVSEFQDWFGNGLRAVLDDGTTVELSRRQAQRFRERNTL